MNGVRFLISEKDLASGQGTRFDHSRAFVCRVLIKVRKGTEKASGIDIRREMGSAPLAGVSKGVIYFLKLVITINQKNVSRL